LSSNPIRTGSMSTSQISLCSHQCPESVMHVHQRTKSHLRAPAKCAEVLDNS
jgi:hypothetical protein